MKTDAIYVAPTEYFKVKCCACGRIEDLIPTPNDESSHYSYREGIRQQAIQVAAKKKWVVLAKEAVCGDCAALVKKAIPEE